MLLIASAHTHRVCATVKFDSDPETEESLLVCPVTSMGALVQQVRAQFDLSIGRRAAKRWAITIFDDETGARLTSATFLDLISRRMGWALTHVTVKVAEKKQ